MNLSNHWKTRLEELPALKEYLLPLAKKWANGLDLPKNMTLGTEPRDPALRAALARIFGETRCRNGKIIASIPDPLRNETILRTLAAELGIEKSPLKPKPSNHPLQRIRLTYPQLGTIQQWIQTAPEIKRLLSADPNAEQLLHSLLETARYLLPANNTITLSKLGSMFFNDSKLLRSGTLLKILSGMLNAQLGAEDSPENRNIALQQFGVIDNPATTTVTLFGPLDLIRSSTLDRWIADRFNCGEPVTLNSYNLENVEAVALRPGCHTVITSENAAPFHELVEENPNAVLIYTAGYPNAAVCRILRLLYEAGTTCRHWGDTDPDGFMIAALINRYIETSLFRCGIKDIQLHETDLKPLNMIQLQRGRQLLKSNPDFKFHEELKLTLKLGRWLEQERH
jgi:hypothetical protein